MKRFISILISIVLITYLLPFGALAAKDKPFIDTKSSSWYDNSLMYCYEHGYMSGTSFGYFSPSGKLTRAMTAQLFYSIDTNDPSMISSPFNDVSKGKWYYDAVMWAYEYGIVSGMANNKFSPDSSVTRQDFYVILYNYSNLFSHYTVKEVDDNYLYFSDNEAISDYALDAMNWAALHGFLSGYEDNTVRPKATITRAEITSIIKRFDDLLGHKWILKGNVTPRSCTSDGHAEYICRDCPAQKSVTYPKGHIRYLSGSSAGTCITKGLQEYRCINCNIIKSEQTVYGSHNYSLTQVVSPTRFEGGYDVYTCSYCKASYKTNMKGPLGRTEGWDSNYDGKLTIDEYFGAYGIVDFLSSHKNDYVGTPYISLADYMYEPWKLMRDRGQYPYNAGMNCTGFVAGVINRSGGNLARVLNVSGGSYGNAYNWLVTLNRNNIFHYTFYSPQAALNSGLLSKGDIFLFLPEARDSDPYDGLDPDFHFGIFWGDTPYHDLFWHSTGATKYNYGYGVRGLKNQITRISSGTPYSVIYVYPLSEEN